MTATTSRVARAVGGSLIGLWTGGPAIAACPYDADTLVEDVVRTEESLRAEDAAGAHTGALALEQGLGCLEDVLPYPMVARVYRLTGAGLFLGGDTERAERWLLTAIEVDPGFAWGVEDVAVGHPLRDTYAALRPLAEADPVAVPGAALVEGEWFLDGLLLGKPRATQGRYHLLQAGDGSGRAWIIEDSGFPAEVLVAGAAVAEADEPVDDRIGEPQWIDAQRPGEKTPLLIGGAATVLGGGGLYAWSVHTRRGFDGAATVEEMDAALRRTNGLVLASSAVVALGASAIGWGAALPPGPKGRQTAAGVGLLR